MSKLERAIINKLNESGEDMRRWNEPPHGRNHPWFITQVYGKIRMIYSITYHFDNYSMVIDSVDYETIDFI